MATSDKFQPYLPGYLPGESPANQRVQLADDEEQRTTAGSGRRLWKLYGGEVTSGSCLRTLLESYLLTTDWNSSQSALRWKTKTTKSNRLLFQLALSAPRTGETASGLWRTPNTFDGLPMKSQKALEHELTHRKGRSEPNNLRDQVAVRAGLRIWPTPQSRDFRTGAGHRWANPQRSRNLNDAVAATEGYHMQSGQQSETTGQLNPTWVEWLMGFPLGWTELDV